MRVNILTAASQRSGRDSVDSYERGSRKGKVKRSLSRKYEDKPKKGDEDRNSMDMDPAADLTTEDYWFFCNRWFARNEDDKKIVRELIATDENGKPLGHGLKGACSIITIRAV